VWVWLLVWVVFLVVLGWVVVGVLGVLVLVMSRAYADLKAVKNRFGCDWRTAAFTLAVERVSRASDLRGL
jgi:hypothetical protein